MGGSRLREGAPQIYLELARYRYARGDCSKVEALCYADGRALRPVYDQNNERIEDGWWLRRVKWDSRTNAKSSGESLRRTRARACAVHVDETGRYWTQAELDALWNTWENPRVFNYLCVLRAWETEEDREVRMIGLTSQGDGGRLAQLRYVFKRRLEIPSEYELVVPVTFESDKKSGQAYRSLLRERLAESGAAPLPHLGSNWFEVEREIVEDLVREIVGPAADWLADVRPGFRRSARDLPAPHRRGHHRAAHSK